MLFKKIHVQIYFVWPSHWPFRKFWFTSYVHLKIMSFDLPAPPQNFHNFSWGLGQGHKLSYFLEWQKILQVHYLFPNLRWMIKKDNPRTRQRTPTVMYAMPRNGFLPPIHEVVLKITLFLPSNEVTGKSGHIEVK